MKAIKIDPAARTVTEITYNNSMRGIQTAIGHPRCNTFCLAGSIRPDTMYVNDEGLYLFDTFFELPGWGQGMFAGPGVIVGKEFNDNGDTRDPKITVAEVTSKIKWLDRQQARDRARELGI